MSMLPYSLDSKVLEIRDCMTFIPVIAVRMSAFSDIQHYYIHRRCGHPQDGTGVLMSDLNYGKGAFDPYDWNDRTRKTAHLYIIEHFDELIDGDVVDVEFILRETPQPKVSERLTVNEWVAP